MVWALLIILLIAGFVVAPGDVMSGLFAGLLWVFGALTVGYLCMFLPPHRTDNTIIQIVGTILWWFFCFRWSGLIQL